MIWLLDHFLSLIFPLKFFQILRCNFIFSKHRAVFTVSCSTVIWFTYVLYKNSLLTSLIFWSLKYLMTYCTQDHLTADAWVSGPDLVPQKFLLSQRFRHLMRCKKYLEKFFLSCLVSEIKLFVYIFGWNSKWPPEVQKGSTVKFMMFPFTKFFLDLYSS